MSAEEAIDIPAGGVTLQSRFVYEWPVRLWHWVNALCVVVLAVTGYYIGNPLLPNMPGEASQSFFIGYVRFAHFTAGYVFAIGILARLYWAFAGNQYARHLLVPDLFSGQTWRECWDLAKYYLLLDRQKRLYVGSNPLDQVAVLLLFTLPAIFLIFTGFALYGEGTGHGSWQYLLFGWVLDLFGGSQWVRTWHRVAMWAMVCYVIIHVYLAIREDVVSRQSYISTMISGYRMFKG